MEGNRDGREEVIHVLGSRGRLWAWIEVRTAVDRIEQAAGLANRTWPR
jgi:hypothetical protein